VQYPPNTSRRMFRFIPFRHREDAAQEAWLAHIQGRSAIRAAERHRIQELRHERHYEACRNWLHLPAPESPDE
jgi:hypothetical protein